MLVNAMNNIIGTKNIVFIFFFLDQAEELNPGKWKENLLYTAKVIANKAPDKSGYPHFIFLISPF